jgi:hypothetical protein
MTCGVMRAVWRGGSAAAAFDARPSGFERVVERAARCLRAVIEPYYVLRRSRARVVAGR